MPGMKEEDIDLELSSDGYLTISGEKKQEHREEHKGSYFSEISYGTFSRTVPLPWELKFDDAKADFENGVLTVTVPKSSDEQGKKRKIAINRKSSGHDDEHPGKFPGFFICRPTGKPGVPDASGLRRWSCSDRWVCCCFIPRLPFF